MHYPLEMHMVHKLFQANATNTTLVPSNESGATLAKAAVIGIMFAYECVVVCCVEAPVLALTRPAPSHHSPADADGAFMAKLIPAMQRVALAGADDSDDTSFNVTSDWSIDTTYGGDIFFNLTR